MRLVFCSVFLGCLAILYVCNAHVEEELGVYFWSFRCEMWFLPCFLCRIPKSHAASFGRFKQGIWVGFEARDQRFKRRESRDFARSEVHKCSGVCEPRIEFSIGERPNRVAWFHPSPFSIRLFNESCNDVFFRKGNSLNFHTEHTGSFSIEIKIYVYI